MKQLFFFIAAAALCWAQPVLSINTVVVEPPAPALPSALNRLVDPTFGTTLMRLTDASDGEQCIDSYSYWPSINVNSTRVVAQCWRRNAAGYFDYDRRFYKLDPVRFTITDKEIASSTSPALIRSPIGDFTYGEDQIWSGVDPDVFFAHTARRLYAVNVATRVWTLIANLSNSVSTTNHLAQMTKSQDDNVFAFSVRTSSETNVRLVAWDRRANRVVLSVDMGHDEVHIDKSGQYLTVFGRQSTPGIQNRVYDLRSGTSVNLTDGSPDYGMDHGDFGMGKVVAFENWTPALTIRNLATPHQFTRLWRPTLLNGQSDWSQSGHISMLGGDGWTLVSTFIANNLPTSGILKNEIWLLATDGSQRVVRLAHHHSVYRSYYDTPRANLSQDGRYVAFTSNWGNSGRTDVFLLKVPENSPSLGAVESVVPSSGSGLSQVFTFTATDQRGSAVIDGVSMLIAPALNPANSCKVEYDRIADRLILANDDPLSGGSSVLPGANTVVSNSQCTLRGLNSRVSIGGTSVDVIVDLVFAASFSGTKNVYLCSTEAGIDSSYVVRGTWTVPGAVGPGGPAVMWVGQGFATVSADGLTVQKTGGCNGCLDAGGISQQQIAAGDGYVEFTRGSDTTFKQIGMDLPSVWAGSVKYGFTLWPARAEIRESGAYRGETTSAAGDVFRIQIIGGQVRYFKNGVLLYTSAAAPVYPLSMQVRLGNLNATFGNARILSATGGTAPAITSASLLPNATAGVLYTQTLAATGGTPPYTWSVANGSSLPPGLTLTAGGVLSGTVAAAGGPFSFTLTVTDNNTLTNGRTFSLTVIGPPSITSSSPLPNATAGLFYTQTLAAAGGTQPYTWSVANGSSLPSGLTLTAAGVLSGTVAAPGGPFGFTLTVTDNNTLTNSRVFSLLVVAGGVAGSVQNATWIRQGFATVSADGLTVQKTGGCTGCLDAGGISQQQITSGDGYVEFTRGVDTSFKQIGIDNPGVWASSVKYGFTVWPTYVEIRENGVYRGDTASAAGDVLRIQIIGGQVKYFKNGVLLYTSTAAPAYPVALQVRLSNLNATFGNARIFQ